MVCGAAVQEKCSVLTKYTAQHQYHHAKTHQEQQDEVSGQPAGPGEAEKRWAGARWSRLQVLLHGVFEGVEFRRVA